MPFSPIPHPPLSGGRRRKTYLFLLFLLISFFLILGFVTRRLPVQDSSASARFSLFTSRLLSEEAGSSGLSLHYMLEHPEDYGVSPSGSFSHFNRDTYESSADTVRAYLDELTAIQATELTEKERIFYEIIEWNLQKESSLTAYPYYEECFAPQSGVQNQILTLLAEYPFRTSADVGQYLSLLADLPAYLSSYMDYETIRAEKGLIVSPELLKTSSGQCADYASLFSSENNFLIETFHNRLEECGFFSAAERAELEQRNLAVLTEQIVPCYRKLSVFLSDLAENTSAGNSLPNDYSDYYEAGARLAIGTDKSIPTLFQEGKTRLGQDLTGLYALFSADRELFSTLSSVSFPEETPYRILSYLESEMKDDFPDIGGLKYEIKQVDDALTAFTAPAFYLIPAMDNSRAHTIYINPVHFSFNNEQEAKRSTGKLFSTLAHEGYPGHLYQNAYFLSTNPDVCRRLFFTTGYAEGWATYAEQYCYKLAALPDNVTQAFCYDSTFSLGIYALCDIGVNYYHWTLGETEQFLSRYGLAAINAESIISAVKQDPGAYLPYYFGYLELESLKAETARRMGEDYSELAFHTYFLSFGPAPFPVLQKWLE